MQAYPLFMPFSDSDVPTSPYNAGIQRSPLAQLESTNQHHSTDPGGEQATNLNFVSEALGMPAVKGYGWAQFEFGDQIGRDNRYTLVRKLGWGMFSSTWLARDSTSVYCQTATLLENGDELTLRYNSSNGFVAVKALTGHKTRANERALACEATVLEIISQQPTSPHCTLLLDEFTTPGRGSARSHLCFAMPVYGGDVKRLITTRTTPLPLSLVKRITLHLLRGIVHTHGHGIVHTDIKPDNIFFSTTMTPDDIETWMAEEPSQRHAPETSHDGTVRAAVSQPLPMISEEEAMRATYVLGDFGCGICFLSNCFDSDTHNIL